ncbi:MAG: hypothetical protein BWX80_00529 [Candidatus Hydrogenedentes bacterium ADurb.Bin101]|nr:MAG: hypothetical protein BWX80_00529 [Candidatus Hydrogenedentes bacterium ADurb.Bin101]
MVDGGDVYPLAQGARQEQIQRYPPFTDRVFAYYQPEPAGQWSINKQGRWHGSAPVNLGGGECHLGPFALFHPPLPTFSPCKRAYQSLLFVAAQHAGQAGHTARVPILPVHLQPDGFSGVIQVRHPFPVFGLIGGIYTDKSMYTLVTAFNDSGYGCSQFADKA